MSCILSRLVFIRRRKTVLQHGKLYTIFAQGNGLLYHVQPFCIPLVFHFIFPFDLLYEVLSNL